MNDSHITATGSQKREFQSLGSAFDRNDFSDLESLDVDEFASDDEEEVIDFEESSRDMKEELGKTSYVGTKYKTMEGLRKKAQSLDKQFNCPITSAKTSKNQFLVLHCRHGGGMNIEKLERDDKKKNDRKMKRKTKKTKVRIDCMRFRPRTGIYFLQMKKGLDGIRLIECNAFPTFSLQ